MRQNSESEVANRKTAKHSGTEIKVAVNFVSCAHGRSNDDGGIPSRSRWRRRGASRKSGIGESDAFWSREARVRSRRRGNGWMELKNV
jgi:hypothetical protein